MQMYDHAASLEYLNKDSSGRTGSISDAIYPPSVARPPVHPSRFSGAQTVVIACLA